MTQNKPKRIKWTDEMVFAEAQKYTTINEFKWGSMKAYNASRRMGIHKPACAHMIPKKIKWTDQMLAMEAIKYQSRKQFSIHSRGAYQAATIKGILDQICAHMPPQRLDWTTEMLFDVAKKYKYKYEFEKNCVNAYRVASNRGLLGLICAHMDARYVSWTPDLVINEAKKYKTRNDFACGSYAAYQAAFKLNITDAAFQHMSKSKLSSDADVIYIWEAVGEFFDGEKIYKIGLTSHRIGERRIKKCAQANKFTHNIIAMAYVGEQKAFEIESALLTLGADPKMDGDGSTEFRALTDQELIFALDYIKHHQIRLAA